MCLCLGLSEDEDAEYTKVSFTCCPELSGHDLYMERNVRPMKRYVLQEVSGNPENAKKFLPSKGSNVVYIGKTREKVGNDSTAPAKQPEPHPPQSDIHTKTAVPKGQLKQPKSKNVKPENTKPGSSTATTPAKSENKIPQAKAQQRKPQIPKFDQPRAPTPPKPTIKEIEQIPPTPTKQRPSRPTSHSEVPASKESLESNKDAPRPILKKGKEAKRVSFASMPSFSDSSHERSPSPSSSTSDDSYTDAPMPDRSPPSWRSPRNQGRYASLSVRGGGKNIKNLSINTQIKNETASGMDETAVTDEVEVDLGNMPVKLSPKVSQRTYTFNSNACAAHELMIHHRSCINLRTSRKKTGTLTVIAIASSILAVMCLILHSSTDQVSQRPHRNPNSQIDRSSS